MDIACMQCLGHLEQQDDSVCWSMYDPLKCNWHCCQLILLHQQSVFLHCFITSWNVSITHCLDVYQHMFKQRHTIIEPIAHICTGIKAINHSLFSAFKPKKITHLFNTCLTVRPVPLYWNYSTTALYWCILIDDYYCNGTGCQPMVWAWRAADAVNCSICYQSLHDTL